MEKRSKTNMEKRSKTNKEIFEQKYPFKELSKSPMLCAEAIGYLKALIQHLPCEETWTEAKMSELVLILSFFVRMRH